jgi:hypothetical protein
MGRERRILSNHQLGSDQRRHVAVPDRLQMRRQHTNVKETAAKLDERGVKPVPRYESKVLSKDPTVEAPESFPGETIGVRPDQPEIVEAPIRGVVQALSKIVKRTLLSERQVVTGGLVESYVVPLPH